MSLDVVIVGAGTAGAAAALACAKAGLRTLCVERRPLAEAGARWVNGVSAAHFDAAGIARPEGSELRGAGGLFHLVAGWGPKRVRVARSAVLEVDMRALGARLRALAGDAGAELLGEVSVGTFDGRALDSSAGLLRARYFVDASGLAGARLLGQPRVPREDLCAAAQEVRRVRDPRAARAYFERHAVAPGDTLCFTGIAGGYSIVNVRLEGDEVSLLTGSIPALGHPSGRQLLDDFVAGEPWIGEVVFGGARPIPLRAPLARLASENVALIGDAGCQVFAAHGSGIGPGLVAARLLAEALARGDGPRGYAAEWHRRYGRLFGAYDWFRRFSSLLGAADLELLLDSGLLDDESARAGLEQRLPALAPRALPAKLTGLYRARRLASPLAGLVARRASNRIAEAFTHRARRRA